jgi:NAD+ synthase (glutamine-hydrolysing)
MSMYSVNTSLAKTVIREMTRVAADLLDKGTSPFVIDRDRAATAASALREILQRPVSPELLPPGRDDTLLQLTESAIGPYELIDFFLWHLVFGRKKPSVVYELARAAFADEYSGHEIQTWFKTFIRRFFHNQFKRTASPEGVAVFPRRLLPENAWQMPGDARPDLWLAELEVHIAGRQESSL